MFPDPNSYGLSCTKSWVAKTKYVEDNVLKRKVCFDSVSSISCIIHKINTDLVELYKNYSEKDIIIDILKLPKYW